MILKKLKIIISALLLMAFTITGCGSNKMYNSGKSNYTNITAVDGISFEIVSDIARNATAITNISPEMSFEPNQTYLYKDGENSYFVFNINSLVFVCEKGTNFGFHALEDKTLAIENDSILGVWLTNPSKKLQYRETNQNGIYKMIATVNAEVALTAELYNDFTGQMAYIYDGETEWTLFVGTVGEDYKDLESGMQETLEYMAATVTTYERPPVQEQPEPEITLGGTSSISDNKVEEDTLSNNSLPEEVVSDNSISQNIIDITGKDEKTEEATEMIVEVEEVEITEEDLVKKTEEELQITEEIEQEESAYPEEKELIKEENTSEETIESETSGKKQTIIASNLNNQKTQIFEDNKIYHSNIYKMVPIGKKSFADIQNNNHYEKAIIHIEKIITGKEAEELIKKYCKTILNYDYFEVPEGCSWHVAKYNVDFSQCSEPGYINVKLKGMDGEILKYRGIRYTSRTYDIKVSDNEMYSYYAVPNGCCEYVLECGDGTVDTDNVYSAYYKVEDFYENTKTSED